MKKILALLLALMLVLSLAACGGNDDPDRPAAERVSRDRSRPGSRQTAANNRTIRMEKSTLKNGWTI